MNSTRENNFDFLRLVFAIFVAITHCHTLSGSTEDDLLQHITNGHVSFSYIGVNGFFIISGYLVFQSLSRSGNLFEYYKKRVLRLFPALIVVLALTTMLGFIVYEGNGNYFTNGSTWGYPVNNLLLFHQQFSINGIFENNPHTSAINGSLWTIPYEFSLYVIVSLFYRIRKREKLCRCILGGIFILMLIGNIFFSRQIGKYGFILSAKYMIELGSFFISGSFLANCSGYISGQRTSFPVNTNHSKAMPLIAFALLILCYPIFDSVKFILLPILIISTGMLSTRCISGMANRIGDMSYGIYIYSFPIQQTLVHFFHFNYISLMICAIPTAILFGYFSWHLIECPALELKQKRKC